MPCTPDLRMQGVFCSVFIRKCEFYAGFISKVLTASGRVSLPSRNS